MRCVPCKHSCNPANCTAAQVAKELDRSAAHVSEITLNHALRTALGASGARYDDEEVLDRLRARKDRSAAGARMRACVRVCVSVSMCACAQVIVETVHTGECVHVIHLA